MVANGIEDFEQAIDLHMTPEPFYLSPDHSAFDTEQAQRICYEYMDLQLAKQVS